MYCRHCGKQISDEAVTCPECGASTKPMTVTPTQHTNEKPTCEDKKSFVTSLINSLGIVGFVLSVFAFVGYMIATFSYYGSTFGSTITPAALAGVSLGIICTKHAKGASRVLAIVGMSLAGLIIVYATILQFVYMF